MKNIDFEEDRTRGGEKKDNKDDKKRQYELSKSYDRVLPENDRKKTGKKGEEFGWPSPPESHPIRAVRKHKHHPNNNTSELSNTPWAKGPANFGYHYLANYFWLVLLG